MIQLLASLLGVLMVVGPLEAQYATVRNVTIESEELDQTREILIYEPMNYEENGEFVWYDVMYVFDAHDRALFDYASAVGSLARGDHRGFVVVGIQATMIEEEGYYRNHDLLPSDTEWNLGPTSGGNAEAFLRYVQNEVVPYVESNYRVLPTRTAVGHSLSASFLIWAMLHDADLFDNWIAISPNVEYDDHRLVNGLRDFDSGQYETPRLFYLSHADESRTWPGWREANYETYSLLLDSLTTDNFRVEVEQYPEEDHRSGFMPSLNSAMRTLLDEIRPLQVAARSDETYDVTFRLHVPDETDEVWISGNQASLGDGAPDQVRMERASPLVREITLPVRDHVEVSFFRDAGAARAGIVMGEPQEWGVPWSTFPMMLRPEAGAVYEFEVERWR
jgi:predicted alpha/beta superfamily hydrolase